MKRVLVADDTNNIRMLLSACLQSDGYEVVSAANGELAQTLLLSEPFDLAFVDVKMPLLSGTQVLKNIREQGITVPVVIITAFATVKNAIECTRHGAVAYLQKPFTAGKVKALIAELNAAVSGLEGEESNCSEKKGAAHAQAASYDQTLTALLMRLPQESENAELYRAIAKVYKAMGQDDKASKFLRCAEVFRM